MIYEFALEPSVLYAAAKNQRDFKDFIRLFDVGAPAVISNFPKLSTLKKAVFNIQPASDCELKKARLEEIIKFLSELPRVKRLCAYDGNLNWKENVIIENERISFDHILTSTHDSDLASLTLDSFFEGQIDYPQQLTVRRIANEMASVIANMLRLSTHIVFVDPYFGDRSNKWKPFLRFIEAALTNKPKEELLIEVIYGFDKKSTPDTPHLSSKLRRESPNFTERCTVVFKAVREKYKGEKIHNRYVLTDIGGVSFAVGLDEEDENHQDDVALLSKESYTLRWQQYARLDGFDLVEQSQA